MQMANLYASVSIVAVAAKLERGLDVPKAGMYAQSGNAINPTLNVTPKELGPHVGQARRDSSPNALRGALVVRIELCAGSARLSATLAAQGFEATAIDHIKNRHRQCHPCSNIDLSSDEGYNYAQSLLKSGMVMYLHAAPPCGAASRAREKKISAKLKRKGIEEPGSNLCGV